MNAFHLLSGPAADALGWTLLHAIWQGFALVLPVAGLLYLLRNRSSVLRYRLGALTLLSQLLLSVATFVWYYTPVAANPIISSHLGASQYLPVRWQAVAQTLPWHRQTQQFLESHLRLFVLLYLVGVVLFGLRLAGGWLYLQRLSRTAVQPTAAIWNQLTAQLRAGLAIRTLVQVRESARIIVPMVVGVLKPVLLVPFGLAANLTTREIEVILAHELAHIKRHDYAVNLLQSVIEVLYFFHPALWWLSARVREEREHCCDDLAIQVCGGNGHILAQALARVEELRLNQSNQTPILAMALTSSRQQLLHRVKRVLGVPTRPFVSNGSLAGLTLATLLLMSVSVYAIQRQQDGPKSSKTQAHSSRKHKAVNGTEYSILDDKKLGYVIWKGKKLPASHVARLQRELDLVMAGQLSLDSVKQPDRDILLTIIETNNSLEGSIQALTEELAAIDYSNIVASALNTLPPNMDEGAEVAIDNSVGRDNVAPTLVASVDVDTIVQPDVASIIRMQDSLAEQREQNSGKIAVLEAKARSQEFAVEAVERRVERIERQKALLEQKRFFETNAQRQLIQKSGFARADSLTKQIEAGEVAIRKVEAEIEALDGQLITIQTDLEKVQNPLRETQAQLRKVKSLYYGAFSYAPAQVRGTARISPETRSYRSIDGDVIRLAAPIPPSAPPAAVFPLRGHAAPASAPSPPSTRLLAPRSAPKPAIAPFDEASEEREEKREKAGKP